MRLVIISNMAHFRRDDGVIVGHGATARELSELAQLFESVRHVACLHDEPAPPSAMPYTATNVELVPVPPAGGETLVAKLGILAYTPLYTRTILQELGRADAIHIRCPANISMIALALMFGLREPRRRWIKYAGNWEPAPDEPWSYAVQRRSLADRHHGAQVTVNGSWTGQPTHVHSMVNPCLTHEELLRAAGAAKMKRLEAPMRLLFVGHLGAAKNPIVAIDALAKLREQGIDARLDLAGGGAELGDLRRHVANRGLASHAVLHGALPRSALNALYDAAHFVVLPSKTEGWPKVLGEGMASGAVPIASAVGSIPEVLRQHGVGRALEMPLTSDKFASAIREYLDEPERWRRESALAVGAAVTFSYSAYLERVRGLFDLSP